MKVVVADSQGILNEADVLQYREKLFFSLLKFGNRIASVKALVAVEQDSEKFYCGVDVELASGKSVSVTVSRANLVDAASAAAEAIENRVAFHVDWQAWLNVEKFSTWLESQRQSLNRAIGLRAAG